MRKLTRRAQPYQIDGYPDYLASLLHARGITDAAQAQRFLNPSEDQLHDPFLMHGMREAVALIKEAAQQGKACAVYGDYDADGVCATAIVLEALQALGIPAFPYIPTRFSEGYGLNEEAITTLSGQAGLLISVDCGITAVSEVRLAKELGMQVILTDHHAMGETLPPADAIVHPKLGHYPDPDLCGAGVAWKLACALLGLNAARASLDLAALATVADLVPLQGENRVIVSLGLAALAGTKRKGLQALMRLAGLKEGTPVQSDHVAFQIAPRLNAGGRLATALDSLNLLTTDDVTEAQSLAEQLDALNRERRDIEQQVLREAAAKLTTWDFNRSRSIVVAGEAWNPGVVGLTAGKLSERWNYPTIVLTRSGDGYSGSGRSAGGIDLHAALTSCAHLLTRFGGHRMAAGLALEHDQLEAFAECFDKAVRAQLGENDLIPETVYDTVLPLEEVNLQTVNLLSSLAPFGLGNPSPQFLLEGLNRVSARAVGADQAHLKLTVAQHGAVREGIAFGQGRSLPSLGQQLSLVASVDQNEFNGRVSAQLKVKAVLPGQTAFAADPLAQAQSLLRALRQPNTAESSTYQLTQIDVLPELIGTRGTLFIAFTAETANLLHQRYPALSTYTGQATDPRAFHAIVFCPDFSAHFAAFERLVFADGLTAMYTAGMAATACRAQEVLVLPKSAGLSGLLAQIAPSVEELRLVYRCLMEGQTLAFTDDIGKDLAALLIYEQLGLVELDEQGHFVRLLPLKKIEPENSPLYRILANLEE